MQNTANEVDTGDGKARQRYRGEHLAYAVFRRKIRRVVQAIEHFDRSDLAFCLTKLKRHGPFAKQRVYQRGNGENDG
jgi:hypothetical protein